MQWNVQFIQWTEKWFGQHNIFLRRLLFITPKIHNSYVDSNHQQNNGRWQMMEDDIPKFFKDSMIHCFQNNVLLVSIITIALA